MSQPARSCMCFHFSDSSEDEGYRPNAPEKSPEEEQRQDSLEEPRPLGPEVVLAPVALAKHRSHEHQKDREKERRKMREREKRNEAERQRERQRQAERERQKQREREKQKQKQRQKQMEKQRQQKNK